MPEISIILPVYNVEKYIINCLESIVNQSYQNFELIVVDDRGSDASMEIAKSYLKSTGINYRIVGHSSNKGLSAARNTGIDIATSPYLLFVDSDDKIDLEALKILHLTATKSNADIISFRAVEYWEETNTIINLKTVPTGNYTSKEYLNYLLNLDTSSHMCFRLFKKDLFQNIKFPIGVVYEDTLTFPYLVCESKTIAQIDDRLYYYYMRRGSITGSKPKNVRGVINHMESLCQYLIEKQNIQTYLVRKFSSALYLTIGVTLVKYAANYKEVHYELMLVLNNLKIFKVFKDKIKKRPSDVMKVMLLKTYPKILHKIYKTASPNNSR